MLGRKKMIVKRKRRQRSVEERHMVTERKSKQAVSARQF